MKDAAIVILNYNGKDMLEKFLPIVLKNSDFEVIIADNCSNDGSQEFLSAHFKSLQLIQLTENLGYSQGYNEALKRIQGQYNYYILLNSDVEVTPYWDRDLIKWLEKHGEYAAVQPKVLSQQNPKVFDYAGAGGGYIDQLGYPFCRGRILETIEEDKGQFDGDVQVDWVSGACFAIKAELFHAVGGFESSFFAHMEEIDLCWRLSRNGWKLGYFGGIKVKHVGGGTLSRTSPFKTYLNFRNNLLMLYRNLSSWGFFKVMMIRVFFDLAAFLHFGLFGKGKHAKQVIKAYRDFFKMSAKMERKAPLASKLPFQRASKQVFSIVLSYYLKRKKYYSEI
ncbi:glycosyltransferase family 2 protein [Echinicola sp. CAU 1574]|uniref:Glycosyltransferase family 2 protein n=1 Tax=Echinicola arenosa TaxID=2774144 RepID=A0ABR9ANV9_9BACT|nr:glycosyltransferase family 2 protein [Echinicola arenosa]MBD8489996.1 glycosyltransferase family 2 protein [Echinicola arenosa]